MIPAPVGFQCRECVRAHTKATRQTTGRYGGRLSQNPRTTSIVLIAINVAIWGIIQVTALAKVQAQVVQFLGLLPRGMCVVTSDPNSHYPNVTETVCRTMEGVHWVPGIADGAWWQVITSVFTHVTIPHIALNCLTLWFLGPPLESLLGRTRFLVTYMLSGLTGSLAIYWLSPEISLSYGGSSAMFGLMGALLIILAQRKSDIRQLLLWLGMNILFTFIGHGISWQGHMGGLVGGAVLACVWAFTPLDTKLSRTQWILVVAILIAIIAGLVARTLLLSS